MQSPIRSAPDLVFGIYLWKQFLALEKLKSNHLWFELQADNEVENRFWIDDVEYPNVLLIEVAIDRSIDLTQTDLSYWRSFGCPIIWIINDDISHQSLSHPIYNQLTKNVSVAGECILNHGAISEYSVTAIARNLLSRPHSPSQQIPFSDISANSVYCQCFYEDHDRSAA